VKATFLKGIVLGCVISLGTLTATAAFAGSGPGGIFNLGSYNGVNGTTKLGGSTAGKQLDITNTSKATGATGIGITVHSGIPPLVVNSSTKVSNLNADLLDGIDSRGFMHGSGKVLQSHLQLTNPGGNSNVLIVPGIISVEAYCGANGVDGYSRNLTNPSAPLDIWYTANGVTSYNHAPTNNTGPYIIYNAKTDVVVTEQVYGAGHLVTIVTASHWTAGGCLLTSQATQQ